MSLESTTINRLYSAFANLDADGMAACYAPSAEFEDEVFKLNGQREVAGMWQMLCHNVKQKGSDVWRLEFRDVKGGDGRGSAHWEARYLFSATGRVVHNRIDAEFDFDRQGLIVRQRDRFSFWAWSRQALGVPGYLFGWSAALRGKVQARASSGLRQYLDKP